MKCVKLLSVLFCLFTMAAYQVTGRTIVYDAPKDTAKINNLIRAGFKNLTQKNTFKNARLCADSATFLCKRDNIEIPSSLHLLLAETLLMTAEYSNASDEANKAMEKAKSEDDVTIEARSLSFLGRYHLRTGFFKEALDYFESSISVARKNKLKGIIPRCYEGEANTYTTIKDIRGYQRSLQNMIEAAVAEDDSFSAMRGYYLLGSSLTNEYRNFKRADSLLKQSYGIAMILKEPSTLVSSLANMGWNYYLEKSYDSALSYYNRSLKYSLQNNIASAAVNSYGNIGTIYRDLGNPKESIAYYSKAVEQAKKINDWYNLSWVYLDMSDLYIRLKDTAKAYNSFVLHKHFSDSLLINKNTEGLLNARLRYETDNHKKEVELLSLRIKNQRQMIYGFCAFIVLTLAIGLLLFRGSKLKAKRRISEMNRKISEITQANLRQQMNPHFIFNTLNSIQYYMYQHDKLATNNYLTKFSNLMRKVLENSQHTSIALHDELDALNLYLELECIRFKSRFEYKINVDEEIDALLFKVPTMLIQPFVENSICHGLMPGDKKGFIKIDLKLEKDYISCTIEDNGIGREAAKMRKASSEENHNSLGTQIVTSRLDLVNGLYGTSLKTIYTDLKNENGEPEGTRVVIHIPIIT
jgi:tetratricopeptide (TPR) repeat protein